MLTDTAIRALKTADRPLKKADGGGLFILVQPSGAKHWRLAYRHGGKQKLSSGGAYPAVGLASARKWRDAAKASLAAGHDPSVARKEEKRTMQAAIENSFATVAEAWLQARQCAWTPRYARIVRTRIEEDILP